MVGLDFTEPEQREEGLRKLGAMLNQPLPVIGSIRCPYPGLRPFGERDCEQFFGREDETRQLLARLAKHPFLAVIGPSGSGKSSLVFAGLVPALRQSGLFGDGDWTMLSMRPGTAPLTAPTVVIGTDPVQAGPPFDALAKAPPTGKTLLVVDQFEELFAVTGRDAPAASQFQEALAALAQQPGCHVMITARADFYPDLMASPLWPHIQQHRYEVLALGDDELRRAIARPAERAGVHIESALVERLVHDAAGEPGALPLMQEVLVYLWEELEGRFIGVEQYEELARQAGGGAGHRSGLQAAMARHADAVFANLTASQQAIARRILLRLIQFGEGRADTRRQQPVAELRSVSDEPVLFESTLDLLARNRLVTLGSVDGGVARGR